ncbi:response regulator [Paenibacillus tritici]|uniref:response regulator n=1 Tax=Paenibacillus tritici TaxID=1873425 RepID=UPI001BA4799C|nr:response regulator [Paenibacillus tritici]QUL53418.1 response regulator [Paenibacillus tritici]
MRKITMIVADDEPVIVNGLKLIIDWDSLGVEIIGEAMDGQELLRLLREKEPDLIVSDICMPGLSGIDVLREIRKSDSPSKVIFISAYKEFAYAQDALKYGALNYLVKPVDTAALEQVVQDAVAVIRNDSMEERNRGKLEYLERNVRVRTTEELLDRLTDGDEGAIPELERIGQFWADRQHAVCVAEWGRVSPEEGRWQERERKLIDFAVANIMGEIVRGIPGSAFFRKKDAFCCLLAVDELDQAVQLANNIRDSVKSYLKIDLAIGIGRLMPNGRDAVASYRQAQAALERAYFIGQGQVLSHNSLQEQSGEYQATAHQAKLLQAMLTASPDAELSSTVSELLDTLRLTSAGSKHAALTGFYSTLMLLRQELNGMGVTLELLEEYAHSFLQRMSGIATLPEMESCFHESLEEIQRQLKTKLGSREIIQIKQVKDYIESHYAENITLDKISGLLYMNSSYFSTFFKKHTGENYKQYLTDVRMKHARRLLLQSELMIYEVAEQVGYSNARLFSEIFRKHFGMIPHEYRQTKGKLV